MSVVICAYTELRWGDLLAAVGSVSGQTSPPLELMVVIDHNPALLERARAEISDVVLLENTGPRGLAGARNTGLAASRGEVIAFLDDDAVAEPDWLEALVVGYRDRDVLGIGGLVQPAWNGGRPRWFPEEFDWVVGCTYRGAPEVTSPVRNLIGANMSFRREVFEAVGGFQDGLGRVGTRPLGCEETELCIRANRHWPCRYFLFQPRARVLHKVPTSRMGWSYFRSRCYAEGLSKVEVSRLQGTRSGLASEGRHVLHALPMGILRGLADAIFRADPSGVVRGLVIAAGLCVTTAGFVAGTLVRALTRNGVSSPGRKALVGERH